MKEYRTACAVFIHAVGAAALGVDLLVLVPKWARFCDRFTWNIEVPKPFLFVASVSVYLQRFVVVVIPVVVFLLWLDGIIHSRLLNCKGQAVATIWANGVTVFLFASLIFIAWAMATPIK
jgi:hypothetical protein